MAAAGGRRRADRIDAKLRGDVVENGNEPGAILRHGNLRKARTIYQGEDKVLSSARNAEVTITPTASATGAPNRPCWR